MTRTRVAGLAALAVGPLGWCLALGTTIGGDPMLSLELAAGAVVGLWAAFLVREVLRSHRFAVALTRGARETRLFGVQCSVTDALGADAVVVGFIRPTIYVGVDLIAALSDEEIRAVLLHEDHHRRTRAPMRAAALAAWLRILGRSSRLREALLERLSDLEAMADTDAIERGSTPSSLARALLKGHPSLQPVSFAYGAERRIEHLLGRAAGLPVDSGGQMPFEWLPIVVLTVAAVACHAAL